MGHKIMFYENLKIKSFMTYVPKLIMSYIHWEVSHEI